MQQTLLSLSASIESQLPESLPLALITLVLLCFIFILLLLTGLLLLYQKSLKNTLQSRSREIQEARYHAEALGKKVNSQNIQEAKLITLLKNERKHGSEKLRLLEEARTELSLQFENLANKILEEKTDRFSELNKEKLDAILTPFNNHLGSLKQEIQEIYRLENRERQSLKNEILQLRDLNLIVNQEAANLTKALKGDTKIQGNWGELVLEKVLEHSGLRKGIEYDVQGGFRDDQNRLYKPDVIIRLPKGKEIIVDSKVSLASWEQFITCDVKEEKQHHLENLQTALNNHIDGLSKKNYPNLQGVNSLDFVLLFMPIEGAFQAVCELSDAVILNALSKNIIIVTPTTLLATLRTIENLWQCEHQSKNSLEIAKRASLMYDKFRGFVEDLEKIGKQLATCQGSFDSALLKLTRGRGNLVAQAEQLKGLGVQTKKDLPRTITDNCDLN